MQGWVGTSRYRYGYVEIANVEIAVNASVSCVVLSEELPLF
jgi:hypothetical protein